MVVSGVDVSHRGIIVIDAHFRVAVTNSTPVTRWSLPSDITQLVRSTGLGLRTSYLGLVSRIGEGPLHVGAVHGWLKNKAATCGLLQVRLVRARLHSRTVTSAGERVTLTMDEVENGGSCKPGEQGPLGQLTPAPRAPQASWAPVTTPPPPSPPICEVRTSASPSPPKLRWPP